uniref:ATP synthase subunit g, mitochondrial-like n=1 Tax=Myxine glutinosa TaxID=7769 RepID=UPI00358DF464
MVTGKGRKKRSANMAQAVQRVVSGVLKKTPQVVSGAVSYCRPHLITFLNLARVELTPPRISDVRPAVEVLREGVQAAKLGHYKQLSVREAVRGGLVAMEVAMWFFVGEVIGRGSLIGYNV